MGQKLFTTGKPDGDPFSQNVLEDHDGTRMRTNDYTVSLAKGDYIISVQEDGKQTFSADVKVTVR